MLWSLAIRLSMFALTMGVIVWIGWTAPQPEESVADPKISPQPQTPSPAQTILNLAPQATAPAVRHPQVATSAGPPIAKAIDLNRASEQDLEMLPGIGPILAERIVAHRRNVGPFASIDDLRAVKGIGKKTFEKIRALVDVAPVIRPPKESKRAA